jgi:ABC-type nitrate/sulfonate/bicarbonate transport system ATPase subunit
MDVEPVELPLIEVRDLDVRYEGGRRVAVAGLSMEVRRGEICSILGPSGCGKSTLLKAIGGFLTPSDGSIRLGGKPVRGPSARCGILFQGLALFPFRTVLGNVEFGPASRGVPREQRRALALDALRSVGLAGRERAYPQDLSQGQQQRVALARAFVNEPEVLLLDEPFSALDSLSRSLMQELLLGIWERRGTTILLVTHDASEALFVGSRVLILSEGPAMVRRELVVDLPRPRIMEVVLSEEFTHKKRIALEEVAIGARRGFDRL